MTRPSKSHPQVSNLELATLRTLIAERWHEGGYVKLYKKMFKEGLIPKKSDGSYLDMTGFKHHYEHIKKDFGLIGERKGQVSVQAIRFLYKASKAAAQLNRRNEGMLKEVAHMTDLPLRVVKDVLAKLGDVK